MLLLLSSLPPSLLPDPRFGQLPIRTRRCLIEDIIEVALMCVHVTHQDTDGNDVDVAHVSKIRVVNALPSELMEVLQTVESKLCVDDRGGARTPSHSLGEGGGTNTPVHGRSPSHSVSSVGSIGVSPRSSPRSNRKHLMVGGSNGSPRSRSVSNSNNSSGGTSLEIFDYPVQVVAEQLTYVDASMFRKIPSLEFLNKSWDRNRYENVAEYTWHFTDRWNGMVEYLATLVLHGDGPEQRASRLEYLIDLGEWCGEGGGGGGGCKRGIELCVCVCVLCSSFFFLLSFFHSFVLSFFLSFVRSFVRSFVHGSVRLLFQAMYFGKLTTIFNRRP